MATYVSYTPTSVIGSAMFNSDAVGIADYKISGTVRVSVSDTFGFSDFVDSSYSLFLPTLYTMASSEIDWTNQAVANVQSLLTVYSQFANIAFQWKGDF